MADQFLTLIFATVYGQKLAGVCVYTGDNYLNDRLGDFGYILLH